VWLSDTDQSSEEDEIVCQRVGFGHVRSARSVLKLLARGIP
jgi:hypothetical protein